jgi:DNA-binding MarR family transcriptional regulator
MSLRDVFSDLVRLETDMWNAIDARLRKEAGVPLGTFSVLLIVDAVTDCYVKDIAEKLPMTVGGASQAVDRIVAKGLCSRKAEASDRRVSIVELTALGKKTIAMGGPVFDDELQRWLGNTDSKRITEFGKTLARLRASAGGRDPG